MKMVTCAGCSRPILERYLFNVLDQSWHSDCVHCCECKIKLTDKCFSRDGKLFCKNDFFKHFGTKCAGCFQGVLPTDLVRKARNKVFHLKCFTCLICHKQLSTGEELYIVDENKFICKLDFLNQQHRNHPHNHALNGSNNNPPTHLHLHHSQGLETTDLDADPGSPSSDMMPDDEDGDDLLTGMGESDRTNSSSHLDGNHHHHHNNHHTLTSSGRSMISHLSSKSSPMSGESASSSLSDSGHGLCSLGETGDSLGGVPGSPSSMLDHHHGGSGSACGSIGGGGGPGSANDENAPGGTKRRGPRTTIKAKQLETLKNAFAATPKPTRHIREQLASETGLNMRVIQVWFQNRRSKERRMKQLNTMAGRRHFFRSPRRAMRPLRPGLSPHDHHGLDDSPEMPGGPGSQFGYFPEPPTGDYPFATGPGGGPDGPGGFVPGYTDFGPGSGPDSYSPDSRPFFGYPGHLDGFNGPPPPQPPPNHAGPPLPPGQSLGPNSMSL